MNEDTATKKTYPLCEVSGKRCYNEREAGHALNALKHHHRSDHLGRQKDLPRRKYFCSFCGTYHLTKQPMYDEMSLHRNWEARFYREVESQDRAGKKKAGSVS